jgi:hypothetical protein
MCETDQERRHASNKRKSFAEERLFSQNPLNPTNRGSDKQYSFAGNR